jgi:predicted metal-dependent hydrolase
MTMSQDDNLIDFNIERAKRVHDLNEKRLREVRQAFEQALPLTGARKKSKGKPKKK